jgi:hypothetical protein
MSALPVNNVAAGGEHLVSRRLSRLSYSLRRFAMKRLAAGLLLVSLFMVGCGNDTTTKGKDKDKGTTGGTAATAPNTPATPAK